MSIVKFFRTESLQISMLELTRTGSTSVHACQNRLRKHTKEKIMTQINKDDDAAYELMTDEEVARALALQGTRHVRRLKSKGLLEYVRLGNIRHVTKRGLHEYMDANRVAWGKQPKRGTIKSSGKSADEK
jgi:hypothetical protein